MKKMMVYLLLSVIALVAVAAMMQAAVRQMQACGLQGMIWAFDSHKVPPAMTNSKKPAITATMDCEFTVRLLLLSRYIK